MKRTYLTPGKILTRFEKSRSKVLTISYNCYYASLHSAYNSWHRAIKRDGFKMSIGAVNGLMIIYKV